MNKFAFTPNNTTFFPATMSQITAWHVYHALLDEAKEIQQIDRSDPMGESSYTIKRAILDREATNLRCWFAANCQYKKWGKDFADLHSILFDGAAL
jgi:hypothetical protein